MNEQSKIHTDKYFINWYETDFKGLATPVAICNFLGESAGRQAEELGFGYNGAVLLNQFWVVLRWAIKIEQYPKWREEIFMETWPRKPEHLYAYRDYIIRSGNGNAIGAATSTWMVLDAKTRRPQKLELVEGLLHHTLDQKALDENARKIKIPDTFNAIRKVKAAYSDIDFNGHVTNSRYVEWCLDVFDRDFHKTHFLSGLEINFLHECRFGDEIDLCLSENDALNFTLFASNTQSGKHIFIAELQWKQITHPSTTT